MIAGHGVLECNTMNAKVSAMECMYKINDYAAEMTFLRYENPKSEIDCTRTTEYAPWHTFHLKL
jgi:hypothetical protein